MSSAPTRIQRKRTSGWRMPDSAVYVGRPTRWGNPVSASDVGGQYPSLSERQVATLLVRQFEVLAERGRLYLPNWRSAGGARGPVTWTYPSVDEIRADLAGFDLACWCPLDEPCHADVLLRLASGGRG
jgi:hypothetical protein